jgi:hypothetical protein
LKHVYIEIWDLPNLCGGIGGSLLHEDEEDEGAAVVAPPSFIWVLFFERDISLNFLIIFYGVSDSEEESQLSKNKLKKNVCVCICVFLQYLCFILVFLKLYCHKNIVLKEWWGQRDLVHKWTRWCARSQNFLFYFL